MTHSLHRFGSEDELKKDYVVMAMASKGINDRGAGAKLKLHLTICDRHHPVNLGGMKVGNACDYTHEEIISQAGDFVSTCNGVFTDRDTVRDVLREIIDQKVGISVVVSGVYSEIKSIADELGIVPHTVNFSLGIWGRKDLIPEPEVLAVITQCGHGMISQNLARHYIKLVSKGYDPHKASVEIGHFCYCAIANLDRISSVLDGSTRKN